MAQDDRSDNHVDGAFSEISATAIRIPAKRARLIGNGECSVDGRTRSKHSRVGGEPDGRVCQICGKADTSDDPVDLAISQTSQP